MDAGEQSKRFHHQHSSEYFMKDTEIRLCSDCVAWPPDYISINRCRRIDSLPISVPFTNSQSLKCNAILFEMLFWSKCTESFGNFPLWRYIYRERGRACVYWVVTYWVEIFPFSPVLNAFINKFHFAGFIEFPLLIGYAVLHSLSFTIVHWKVWIKDQETTQH